jgi:carboxylate-amine ligase
MLDGQFTLGVEEEYQIVDPESRELRSYVSRLLEDGKSVLRERVRMELHQSMVEVGTTVCNDVWEVHRELVEMRTELDRLARRGGLRVVAASTHPFSDWKTQDISPGARYQGIVDDLQDVARANLIFGLHVHVGIKNKELAIALANQVRYFLPHILALSTSSPFWLGRRTGLMSTRSQIFKRFPRTGIPDEFESQAQLQDFVNLLIKTGCIDDGKKIWWDVRPHYLYDTVELRVCDMPTRMDHTIALVALIQALMAKLYMLWKGNTRWRSYTRSLIEENKWRAVRFGTDAKLIDFGRQEERPFADLAVELVEFVDDAAKALGTRDVVARVLDIAKNGTSAHRQIEVYEKRKETKDVVDWLIAETMHDLDAPMPPKG